MDFKGTAKGEYKNDGSHTLYLYSKAFESWRALATTYGHELVHMIHYVNGDRGRWSIDQKRPFGEALAYFWSSNYSGDYLDIKAFNDNLNKSLMMTKDSYGSIFSKFMLNP